MKRLTFFFILFLFISDLFSQTLIPETEVILLTRNAGFSNQETIFEVYPLQYENITTAVYRYYGDGSCIVGVKGTGTSVKLKGNVVCSSSGLEYIFYDETWLGGESCEGSSEFRPFANALYEIKIKVDGIEKFKFILDTRHNSLTNGCDNNCRGNDISIVYFINTNTVGASNGFWQDGAFRPVEYGRYYTWWEIRNNNCSIALSKFNELYLPILLEPVVQNSSPFIEWVKASSTEAETTFYQYDLQRSVNYGSFVSIFQTDDFNETSYLDADIFYNPNQTGTIIQYRVVAIYNVYEPNIIIDVSNYREINTNKWYLMKNSIYEMKKDYNLSHNYPNPFNPSTKITYQIQEEGFVSLIIYDVLGREISILVDGFKEPGKYTADFDVTGLNSGVYFYRLMVNNYTETKQMILLK